MSERFVTFAEFSAYLDRLGLFHMDLTLDRVREFARRAGLGRPPFAVAHVLGTNGKGSTSTFLESIAREHSLKTGLYTSPHFLSFRERIKVGGRMLPEERWTCLANRAMSIGGDLGLTYFELLTCMAVLAFAEDGVELAVMEAGLGGRYDAVSAFETDLTLFTPIGLDHMRILGDTLVEIAADKADAMPQREGGGLAVTGWQEPEALAVLRSVAERKSARLLMADWLAVLPDGLRLRLAGPHQRQNALLALAGWRLITTALGREPDALAEARGLERAFIPGRLQHCPGVSGVSPDLLLDGAHNEPGLRALLAAVEELHPRPAALLFSCLKDKELSVMAPLAAGLTDGPILVTGLPGCERSRDPVEIATFFAALGRETWPFPDPEAALADLATFDGPVLACGSLYLLAALYTKRPECLENAASA
ncbi:bifunctional folylpolyglutamate synthase/dihydrofolate synthase [Desulfocurvibacter africanus]|uniref:bifunctional folylpolyglutamate synthase/dihydrofolate synthase n=1 Tax=Desulfocurvibacter africanus TaxID=873 RepID=UPI000483114E|nr:Mur ligase family protein [Desulfocurvibacter africanus]